MVSADSDANWMGTNEREATVKAKRPDDANV
jgi:hypothetical protein